MIADSSNGFINLVWLASVVEGLPKKFRRESVEFGNPSFCYGLCSPFQYANCSEMWYSEYLTLAVLVTTIDALQYFETGY